MSARQRDRQADRQTLADRHRQTQRSAKQTDRLTRVLESRHMYKHMRVLDRQTDLEDC